MGINNLVWAMLFLVFSVIVIEGTHTAMEMYTAQVERETIWNEKVNAVIDEVAR